MWIPRLLAEPASRDKALSPEPQKAKSRRRKRLGVTAMEYLVCISVILVVVIATVQHLGRSANKMMADSAAATGKTVAKE